MESGYDIVNMSLIMLHALKMNCVIHAVWTNTPYFQEKRNKLLHFDIMGYIDDINRCVLFWVISGIKNNNILLQFKMWSLKMLSGQIDSTNARAVFLLA